MFNVKLFADFGTAAAAEAKDHAFLSELARIRSATTARYVNFSIADFRNGEPEFQHYLTYPGHWITHCISAFYPECDPVMMIDHRRLLTVDWKSLRRQNSGCDMFEKLEQFGIGNNGLTVSTHVGGPLFCGLSLTFNMPPECWGGFVECREQVFRSEANRLGTRHRELFGWRAPSEHREREVLEYVAAGSTDEQVAKQLGIGKWTVVSHLQSAKYKLNCPNRAAAVAKAITHGLIRIAKENPTKQQSCNC